MVGEGEQEGLKEEGSKYHHLAFAQLPPDSVHPGQGDVGQRGRGGAGGGACPPIFYFPPHSLPANSEQAQIPANWLLGSMLTKGLLPLFLPLQLRSLHRKGPFSQYLSHYLPPSSNQRKTQSEQSPTLPGYSERQCKARVGFSSDTRPLQLQQQESLWPGQPNAENKVPFRSQGQTIGPYPLLSGPGQVLLGRAGGPDG